MGKELEISGIQDMRSKHKQNWINHLDRMDNTRLPKHALNYKPRGRRDRGPPGNDDSVSMPEQVKRPNPWRLMMMMNVMKYFLLLTYYDVYPACLVFYALVTFKLLLRSGN